MNKFLFIILSMLPLLSFAQYYNPFSSYQRQQSNQNAYNAGAEAMKQIMEQQRQTNQNAYNAGAEAMKQIMEQQEEKLKQNPTMMMNTAIYEMSIGKYEKAYGRFDYLSENYNDKYSWLYKGYMNELGMGTSKNYSYAKMCYKKGAELGEQNSVLELKRIRQNKYLGDEKKKTLVSYFRMLNSQSNNGIGDIATGSGLPGGSYNNSSYSSYSSSGRTCRSCNGNGQCTMCMGAGYYWNQVGYFIGSDVRKKQTCSSCSGTGRCRVCYGKGMIY